jgi:hypothetical protein
MPSGYPTNPLDCTTSCPRPSAPPSHPALAPLRSERARIPPLPRRHRVRDEAAVVGEREGERGRSTVELEGRNAIATSDRESPGLDAELPGDPAEGEPPDGQPRLFVAPGDGFDRHRDAAPIRPGRQRHDVHGLSRVSKLRSSTAIGRPRGPATSSRRPRRSPVEALRGSKRANEPDRREDEARIDLPGQLVGGLLGAPMGPAARLRIRRPRRSPAALRRRRPAHRSGGGRSRAGRRRLRDRRRHFRASKYSSSIRISWRTICCARSRERRTPRASLLGSMQAIETSRVSPGSGQSPQVAWLAPALIDAQHATARHRPDDPPDPPGRGALLDAPGPTAPGLRKNAGRLALGDQIFHPLEHFTHVFPRTAARDRNAFRDEDQEALDRRATEVLPLGGVPGQLVRMQEPVEAGAQGPRDQERVDHRQMVRADEQRPLRLRPDPAIGRANALHVGDPVPEIEAQDEHGDPDPDRTRDHADEPLTRVPAHHPGIRPLCVPDHVPSVRLRILTARDVLPHWSAPWDARRSGPDDRPRACPRSDSPRHPRC